MNTLSLKAIKKIPANESIVYIIDKNTDLKANNFTAKSLTADELAAAQRLLKDSTQTLITFHRSEYSIVLAVCNNEEKDPTYIRCETLRNLGHKTAEYANTHKFKNLSFVNISSEISNAALYAAEGAALGNYQFLKYRKNAEKERNSLETIQIYDVSREKVEELEKLTEAVYICRNLVNEPLSYLTAPQFSEEIEHLGKKKGFEVTVFKKKQIEEMGMGGLLSVNKGSNVPPRFNILEWKPAKAVNTAPIVLVGKGVVFDTGGLSLKPTPDSMDYMKCDMAGAAAVLGALCAAADNQLPLHIIGLIPATDNRPGEDAYVPGDVITQYDGTTIEVLNTDAEGRLILADALAYAKQYNPELVIDLATLTGAAARALGIYAIAMLSNADTQVNKDFINSGFEVYERMIEFPLWKEYGDMMKSDIADMKNIGGPLAGHITAAKFLEHFTAYPWIHLDIAGVAYLHSPYGYRGKNASGVGVRLLYDFLATRAKGSETK